MSAERLKGLLTLLLLFQTTACTTTNDTDTPSTVPETFMSAAGCGQTSTENFEGYIKAGWQRASPTLQQLLIASDPQPFRVTEGVNSRVDRAAWERSFNQSYTSMMRLVRSGDYHVPLIINGDMSDFGHGNERKAFRDKIKLMGHADGPLMLPGLGNHDYANNLNDCANNGCIRDAVCDHITWVESIRNKSTGVNFDHSYWRHENGTHMHRGSLSYSVDIGKVHVVQLNMEPTYEVHFSTGVDNHADFTITQSMDWLQADLEAASRRGQYSIINMHRWKWDDETQYPRFKEIIAANKVVGIFLGHIHENQGYATSAGKVPVFYPGVLDGRYHSRLLFDWKANALQVNWYSNYQERGEMKYDLDTLSVIAPIQPDAVTVTLYQNKNFSGATCSGEVATNKPFTLCDSHTDRPGMSMKVKGFDGNGRQLCIKKAYTAFRCYHGNYRGDFEIPAFDRLNSLPQGLIPLPFGKDTGYTWMSYE